MLVLVIQFRQTGVEDGLLAVAIAQGAVRFIQFGLERFIGSLQCDMLLLRYARAQQYDDAERKQ